MQDFGCSDVQNHIQEKRVCGYKYHEVPSILKQLDQFLCENNHQKISLPESFVLQWLKKRPQEQASTHQRRIVFVRQLAEMMTRLNYSAYIVPYRFGTPRSYGFSPYIFKKEEVKKLIYAADQIKPCPSSPFRNIIFPEIFRLLYSCGFRLGEVINLRVRDVDLKQGVITVKEAKFGKDRLVPLAIDMVQRLRIYVEQLEKNSLEKRKDSSFFFPSPTQTAWHSSTIYFTFRKLLHQCNISHGGRGKGPRVHDLRHTFAVHRLIQWYEANCDLNAKLPLLVAYLGHKDFTGTQKYLHLTAELFPKLTACMNKQFGGVIPQVRTL